MTSPYAHPPDGAPVAASKRRWRWLVWLVVLGSLLVAAVVVTSRVVSEVAGKDNVQLGQIELRHQSTAYPGMIEARFGRSGSCGSTLRNARDASFDLSCLRIELSPQGDFGAQFMLESEQVGRIGEVPPLGMTNAMTSVAVVLRLAFKADIEGDNCLDGLCLGSLVTLSGTVNGDPVQDDGGLHAFGSKSLTYNLDQGDSVTLTGTTASATASRGSLDSVRNVMFAVAYGTVRPGTGQDLTYTVIGIHPFGDGQLDPEQFLRVLKEVG